jgi:hypothetical protein
VEQNHAKKKEIIVIWPFLHHLPIFFFTIHSLDQNSIQFSTKILINLIYIYLMKRKRSMLYYCVYSWQNRISILIRSKKNWLHSIIILQVWVTGRNLPQTAGVEGCKNIVT